MFSVLALVAISAFAVVDEYTVTVNSIGIGNTWAGGYVTPLHVNVQSKATTATQAWVQWEIPNADGDTVFWGKPITLSPGTSTSTWLYAPVQPWADSSTSWTVRVRDWDGSTASGNLAIVRFSANSVNSMPFKRDQGLIAILGTRRMGLEHYLPMSHPDPKQEASILVSGLTVANVPDSWPSFDSLDALVWADAPPLLSIKQETAIEDWVERGGHLLISLPSIGDPWNIGSTDGPLSNLLQGITAKVEEIPIAKLDEVLGRKNNNWPEMNITARSLRFTPNYVSVLRLENGSVVGIQKNVGFGAVTVIGIDLTSGLLSSIGLPETNVFWRNVFSKRGDTPTQALVTSLKENDQLSTAIPIVTQLPLANMVAQKIAMSESAGGKLGTIFLLIVAYWIISGPISFYILKKQKKQRWAWVTFASIAGTFAIATWAFAASTSGVKIPLKHVSIIDHVYGVSGQRVVGWYSLFLPSFGRSHVKLEGEQGNLLLPWSAPDASLIPPFVDTREVVVNLEHIPDSFNQPSRATTANFAYEWVGGIDNSFYSSLIRVDPQDEPRHVASYKSQGDVGTLRGKLVNHATVPLHDVTIIWVTDSEKPLSPLIQYPNSTVEWFKHLNSGGTLHTTHSWRWDGGLWNPDGVIDLSTFTDEEWIPEDTVFDKAYVRYIPDTKNRYFQNNLSESDWRMKMEMLSLYSNLKPPFYMKNANDKKSKPQYQAVRDGGHELDLAQWFGRPCVIVMGFIPNAPIPVKISVDGDEIRESTGENFCTMGLPAWE